MAAKKVMKKVAPKAKKAPAKKASAKKATVKTAGKANAAFMKVLKPSEQLAAVIGAASVPRTEVVKKIWVYIKKNKLQNPKNMRNILADAKLKAVFGKLEVTMFEMTKLLSKHLE